MTILKNKVALVTGSARGIGKAIALRYATLGADIVVNYSSDETNASQTVAEIKEAGREALAVKADISKPDEIDDLFAQAIGRFGRVDIVVANAGVETSPQPVADVSEEQFDRVFGVNTKGAFFTLQKAAQRVSDNGRIIYIGSSTTCDPMPGFGLYGSSKMAAGYLVGVLAQELGPRGVTVNAIVPTAIDGAGMFTGIDDDHPYHAFMEEFRRPIGARMGRSGWRVCRRITLSHNGFRFSRNLCAEGTRPPNAIALNCPREWPRQWPATCPNARLDSASCAKSDHGSFGSPTLRSSSY